MIEVFQAVLIGLVEGLTEFIPISSTGHMIVVGRLIGFEGATAESFVVLIQLGAILAVVILYKERFLSLLSFEKGNGFAGLDGIMLLGLTTLPALLVGGLFHSAIKTYLFNPMTVAAGLGLGGMVMIISERKLPLAKKVGLEELKGRDALLIGFFQCLAMWPGVSRSAATIVGGMLIGIERKTAAEYSFLAAVPVMCAATIYEIYESRGFLHVSDIPTFVLGFSVAFASAWLAVKFFIRLLGSCTLKPFGWYRIVIALLIVAVSKG